MTRAFLLFAVVLMPGCSKGTCITTFAGDTTTGICSVNSPKRTCDSANERHSEFFSENGSAGLERCKAAGFTRPTNSQPMTQAQIDEKLEEGEPLTMGRPVGVQANK